MSMFNLKILDAKLVDEPFYTNGKENRRLVWHKRSDKNFDPNKLMNELRNKRPIITPAANAQLNNPNNRPSIN